MGRVDDLAGTVVGLDTSPLIHFIEKHSLWHPVVRPFCEALDQGLFEAVTSTVTLTEVLVLPLRRAGVDLALKYKRALLNGQGLSTVSVSPKVADRAAQLRADFGLRTPDAIQVATALESGADSFLTNNAALARRLAGQVTLRLLLVQKLL